MRDDSDSNMYDSLLRKPVELKLTCIMHNMQNTHTFRGHISVAFIIDYSLFGNSLLYDSIC